MFNDMEPEEELKIPIPKKNTDLNGEAEKKTSDDLSNKLLMTDSSL
jgi:hypothetical protein